MAITQALGGHGLSSLRSVVYWLESLAVSFNMCSEAGWDRSWQSTCRWLWRGCGRLDDCKIIMEQARGAEAGWRRPLNTTTNSGLGTTIDTRVCMYMAQQGVSDSFLIKT
jgi:hypothetical protein